MHGRCLEFFSCWCSLHKREAEFYRVASWWSSCTFNMCVVLLVGLLGPWGENPTAEGTQASGHRGPFRSLFAYFRISSDHLASGLVVVSEECIPTLLDGFKIGLMISHALRGESLWSAVYFLSFHFFYRWLIGSLFF